MSVILVLQNTLRHIVQVCLGLCSDLCIWTMLGTSSSVLLARKAGLLDCGMRRPHDLIGLGIGVSGSGSPNQTDQRRQSGTGAKLKPKPVFQASGTGARTCL